MAATGPKVDQLLVAGQVVECVLSLDRAPQGQVTRKEHVRAVEGDQQEAAVVYGPIPGTSVKAASISWSVMAEKAPSLRRPSTNLSASALRVSPFRTENPLSRRTFGSAATVRPPMAYGPRIAAAGAR